MKRIAFIFLGFFSVNAFAHNIPAGTPSDIPGKRIPVVSPDEKLFKGQRITHCGQILDVISKRHENSNIKLVGSSYIKPYYDRYTKVEMNAPRFECQFTSNGRGVREQIFYYIEFRLDDSLCEKGVTAAFKSNLADPPYQVCGDNQCWFNVSYWERNANAGQTDENGKIPKFWGFGKQTGVACGQKTDLGDAVPPPESPKPPKPKPPEPPPPPPKKGCDEGQAMCEQPEGGCGDGFTSGTFNGKAMCVANGKPNSPPPDANNGGGGDANNSSSGGSTPNSGGTNPNASIPNPYLPNTTPVSGGGAVGGSTSNGSSSANGNHAHGGNSGTGGVSFGGHVNGKPNSDNKFGNANGNAKEGGKEGDDDKGKGGKGDGDGDSYPDMPESPALPLVDLGKSMKLSEKIFNASANCPADRTLSLSKGFSYTFSFSKWCEYLRILGYLILIASYIYAINIVSRDI